MSYIVIGYVIYCDRMFFGLCIDVHTNKNILEYETGKNLVIKHYNMFYQQYLLLKEKKLYFYNPLQFATLSV